MKILEERLEVDEQQLRGVQGDLQEEIGRIDKLATDVGELKSDVDSLKRRPDRGGQED